MKRQGPQTSDRALLALLAAGDIAALGAIYDRYAPGAFALCRHLLDDQSLAEESLAEVFETLWHLRKRVKVSSRGLDGYIHSLVRLDARRRVADRASKKMGHAAPSQGNSATAGCRLEDVLRTELLAQRPAPPPNLEAENAALHAIADELMNDPQATLDVLTRQALALCEAGSSGVSLLERRKGGSPIFRWVAVEGQYSQHLGGTTPFDFSPCGTSLQLGSAQLFIRPERYFTYFREARPEVVEGLVVPLRAGEIVGTVWVATHTDARQFHREDARIMTSLAGFAAAAIAAQHFRLRAERNERELAAMAEQRARSARDT